MSKPRLKAHVRKLKARVNKCPNCGSDMHPVVTVNEKGPVHPVDKWAKKVGIDCFFPHIDVDYLYPCGFHWHGTWTLKGEFRTASGGMTRYKRVEVEIEGLTPLIMDRLALESLKREIKNKTKKYNLKEAARNSAYIAEIDGKETLYIPSRAVYACILNMSKHFKIGKFRFSHLFAGSVRVEPEKIPLNKTEYEVDIRAVRGGRGTKKLKARAKVWPWKAQFQLVAEKPLPIQQWNGLEEVISGAGTMNGRGHYGTFRLKSFRVLKE